MKVGIIFICCLVAALSSAQMLSEADPLLSNQYQPLQAEKSYVSEVEMVDNLETAPNPSLVPHYFLQQGSETQKGIGKKVKKVGKKIAKAIKKGAKKVKKAAKKVVKALGKKMKKLRELAKKGDKAAIAKLKKLAKKFKKGLKKLSGADKAKAKEQLKKSKDAAAKATVAKKKTAEELAAAKKKRAEKRQRQQKRLDKRAKKTDTKVRRAMDKLRHLHTNMDGLKRLMGKINNQIQGLLPEKRIRKYGLDEVEKISHSLMTGGLRNEKKLVDGYKSAAEQNSKSEDSFASSGINFKATPVIRKDQDMNVQELSAKAIQDSKFTKKLADKDTISLV